MMNTHWDAYTDQDLVRWLQERSDSDDPALTWVPFVGPPRTWTYRQLVNEILSTAAGLQSHGSTRGSVVGLFMDNCPEMVISWFAVITSGASALCINARSRGSEIAWIAHHSGANLFLTDETNAPLIAESVSQGTQVINASFELPRGENWIRPEVDPRALASIQYTSGTTARPKGVRWTHANCLWAAQVNADHQELTNQDVYLVTLPLFHTNALAYQLLPALHVGAHLILQPRFSSSRFWDISRTYGCTWTGVVHFIVRALHEVPSPANHTYRGWAGSAVAHATSSPAGIPITGWFGMTETISHPTYVPPSRVHDYPSGSIGSPAPEYEVRIDEDGPRTGELVIRGVRGISVFDGYLNDEEATARVLDDDGWFRTGDRVRVDDADNYYFVERMGDVFKVGGENVSAAEIEQTLGSVDGVSEICVVAGGHAMLGYIPIAFVVSNDDHELVEAELRSVAKANLSDFKNPRRYVFLEEFPRSTLNKVAKHVLREQVMGVQS